MKKQFLTLLTVAFILFIAPLVSSYGDTLPEPILPLREEGEYAQRIEALKKLRKNKASDPTFINEVWKIYREIEEKQDERRAKLEQRVSRWTVSTRAEFAALEWLYYLALFIPAGTPKEVWDGYTENSEIWAFYRLSVESSEFLKREKIDADKLHHERATYRAFVLRKIQKNIDELTEEKAVIEMGIRYFEEDNASLKYKIKSKLYLDPTKRNIADEQRARVESINFKESCKRVIYRVRNRLNAQEGMENRFLKDLLRYFENDLNQVNSYLALVGYNTEEKRAAILSRFYRKTLDDMEADRLFQPYKKKFRFAPVAPKNLALKGRKQVAEKLSLHKKKWEPRLQVLRAENAKLVKERQEQEEQWYKENPNIKLRFFRETF